MGSTLCLMSWLTFRTASRGAGTLPGADKKVITAWNLECNPPPQKKKKNNASGGNPFLSFYPQVAPDSCLACVATRGSPTPRAPRERASSNSLRHSAAEGHMRRSTQIEATSFHENLSPHSGIQLGVQAGNTSSQI